jgi:hypothetical protein
MLKVSDLLNEQKQRKGIKKQVYKDLLSYCYKKIQNTNLNNKSCFTYKLGIIKIGFPLYDLNYAIQYIALKLRKGGFAVTILNENTIFIDWSRP